MEQDEQNDDCRWEEAMRDKYLSPAEHDDGSHNDSADVTASGRPSAKEIADAIVARTLAVMREERPVIR